jgi:hypothetical protein
MTNDPAERDQMTNEDRTQAEKNLTSQTSRAGRIGDEPIITRQ